VILVLSEEREGSEEIVLSLQKTVDGNPVIAIPDEVVIHPQKTRKLLSRVDIVNTTPGVI
jgi:hypothetical protein